MNKFLLVLMASSLISGSAVAYDACGRGTRCCQAPVCYTDSYCDDACASCDQFYVGALGGVNFLELHKSEGLHDDTGWLAGGVLGYRLYDSIRVEAEVAYRRNALHDKSLGVRGHMSTTTVMANVLYDFNFYNCWTPYLGFGLGYANNRAHLKGNAGSAHVSGDHFAAQAIAGLAYRIAPKTDLGLEYRYLYPAKHIADHGAVLSVRQYF